MNYSVETTYRFERKFKELDRYTQRMIKAWIQKNQRDVQIHASTVKDYQQIRADNGVIVSETTG